MGTGNDEAKRLLLARRARFVATTLASMAGVAALANACSAEPCLSLRDNGGGLDAGTDDGDSGDAGDAGDGGG